MAVIAASPSVSPRDRIEAHKAIADIEMMVANLTGYAATTARLEKNSE